MPLAIGSIAPDFTLPSSDGGSVTLSSFRDRQNVVLIFYPKDQTPGCTAQLCAARDDRELFSAAGTAVFGISGDDLASHARFIAKHQLTMPLLTDRGLAVAKAYDALIQFGPIKVVNRTVVGVDRAGRIAAYKRGAPSADEVLKLFSAASV